MTASTADDTANPMPVPIDASNAVWPVASALERSTDNVPSATQNAWSTPSDTGEQHCGRRARRRPAARRGTTRSSGSRTARGSGRTAGRRRSSPGRAGRSRRSHRARAPRHRRGMRCCAPTTRECHAAGAGHEARIDPCQHPDGGLVRGDRGRDAPQCRRTRHRRTPRSGRRATRAGPGRATTQAAASRQSAARCPSAVISGVSCTYGSPSSAAMTRAREPSRSTI